MSRVQSLWNEFDAAKARLTEIFAEPSGVFEAMETEAPKQDGKVVRLHDATRKKGRKKTRKTRKTKSA